MYLFMDVLINQPRNADSSTSLTASIALGSKFFPPTLNLKSSFNLGYVCLLFPINHHLLLQHLILLTLEGSSESVSHWHFQTIGDPLDLGDTVAFNSLIFKLFAFGSSFWQYMVLRVAICPKWPSPICPCPANPPCDFLSYLWPLLAVANAFTFTGLRFHFEIYMDRSNRSIKLLVALWDTETGSQNWMDQQHRKNRACLSSLWLVREVH